MNLGYAPLTAKVWDMQVLVLSCGLLDVTDLVWWQPYHTPLEKDGPPRQTTAWLPGAIEVIADPEKSEVGPNVVGQLFTAYQDTLHGHTDTSLCSCGIGRQSLHRREASLWMALVSGCCRRWLCERRTLRRIWHIQGVVPWTAPRQEQCMSSRRLWRT